MFTLRLLNTITEDLESEGLTKEAAALHQTFTRLAQEFPPAPPYTIQLQMDDEGSASLNAQSTEGTFIGNLGFSIRPDLNGKPFATIGTVFVRPQFREQGIATALYQALREYIRTQKVDRIEGQIEHEGSMKARLKTFGKPQEIASRNDRRLSPRQIEETAAHPKPFDLSKNLLDEEKSLWVVNRLNQNEPAHKDNEA